MPILDKDCKLKTCYKRNKREDNPTHYRNRAITGVCDRTKIGITTVPIKVH
ncbi:hypothetical protein [Wolbachia endosymbiont (group A) of Barypeithes pellucidus]|uniref:hypothetical protein n=1 Tax=Wolbachia endosymbiont (group A) of Barypeithes pellucidus TaxID=3139322 RepID=UPI003CCB3742